MTGAEKDTAALVADRGTGRAHGGGDAEASVGELVARASEQLSEIVRGEMQLAQAEMKEKGKRAGLGAGMFGGAGLAAFLALQALVGAAVAALALHLPVWASALIVGVVLLLVAAVLSLVGKKEFGQATPPAPEQTIDSVKADVQAIKEGAHR
ncbi:phage holin family protein [Streptomyces sp. NPDC054784]